MEFEVIVEVPKGSRNKYEVNHETGIIHLDRELFTATRYPAEYGYIEHTWAEDGDPLDVLVMLREPTFPGCRIRCRAIGIFAMQDEKGPDHKILAVPVWDQRQGWFDLSDVPRPFLKEIAHFFDIYKDLEEGKATTVGDWTSREGAEEEIRRAQERYSARRQDEPEG
ncbi:MAG: inorganic diphosphatase [Candidatus Dormibacteraeota bacterium]|nr:inorganic diphosphatase [Candidatus Dormibacteraeota bacterium]